jgi:hypothetical protein
MNYLSTIAVFFVALSAYTQGEIINQERKRLIHDLEMNTLSDSIYTVNTGRENQYYLTLREQEWMLIFQHKLEVAVQQILANEQFMMRSDYYRIPDIEKLPRAYRFVGPHKDDSLANAMNEYLENYFLQLVNTIRYTNIDEEDRLFLVYYLNYSLYQIDICNKSKQQIAIDEAQELLRIYPDTRYKRFVYRYSQYFLSGSNSGFTFSFGLGSGILQGGLSEYMNAQLGLGYSLSYNYKNFGFGFTMPMVILNTKVPFQGVNEPFEEDRKARLLAFGIHASYSLRLGEVLAVEPYLGYSINEFSGLYKNEAESEVKDFKSIRNGGLFYGLNIDLGPKRVGCSDFFSYEKRTVPTVAPFFRIQAGVMHPEVNREISELTGDMIFFNIGMGAYIKRFSRKKILE